MYVRATYIENPARAGGDPVPVLLPSLVWAVAGAACAAPCWCLCELACLHVSHVCYELPQVLLAQKNQVMEISAQKQEIVGVEMVD